MSTRLDDLLEGASPGPGRLPDPDGLWSAGRRRRRWRHVGAVVGVVALIGVSGGVVAGMDSVRTPEIGAVAPPEAGERVEVDEPAPVPDEPPEPDVPVEEDEPVEDEPVEDEPVEDEPEPDEPSEVDDPPAAQPLPDDGLGPAPAPGLEPDAGALEDPCAPHQDGEPASFIDLVSPVEGQTVSDGIELAGCASVHEATVRYRLVESGGEVVADDFTTATAGGPDIGEFDELVALGGVTGELTLEVFWDSPADGSEADKTTVTLHAE